MSTDSAVDGFIRATAGQRVDVVDDVTLAWPLARTSRGAWVLLLELDLCGLAALDPGVCQRGQERDRKG